jgi:(E)-4-hydroxy-3-methylbut-2-enyl-diphosphate synthase
MMPNGLKVIQTYTAWQKEQEQSYPLLTVEQYTNAHDLGDSLRFLQVQWNDLSIDLFNRIKDDQRLVLVLSTNNDHAMAELRRVFFELMEQGLQQPVIVKRDYAGEDIELVQLYASTDVGGLLIDGWGDGVMLSNHQASNNKAQALTQLKQLNSLGFGILQAARTRMTKTEYISCPSCGRTLFDLQETTAMIRKRTDHLKGVKIGIMGCIVNGPGEMADADYGYVGSGKGKITLYRSKTVVKRGVPSEQAVDELIELIREDGKWLERPSDN